MPKYLVFCFILLAQTIRAQHTADSQVIEFMSEYQAATCLIIYDGRYTCTGTLINNTSEDGRPLILSSAHCIDNPEQFSSIVVVFGQHFLNENSAIESKEWRSDFGASLLSFSYETDHALLELNEDFPDWLMPKFLGWNSQGTNNGLASTIHHPTFDFKEFAHTRSPLTVASFAGVQNSPERGFWCIEDWTIGSVNEGSSGAGLLDYQMRVIGGLSGATLRGSDSTSYFYRLDQAWGIDGLSTYLDIENTGATSLEFTDFGDLRDLSKVSNHAYTSEVIAGEALTIDHSIVEEFGVMEGDIAGVYLPVEEISADLLNSLTISLRSDGEELFAVEVSLFTLQERVDNFVPLLADVSVDGEVSIGITLNSDLANEQVVLPRVQIDQQPKLMASLLVRDLLQPEEIDEEANPPVVIFPNPTERYLLVNEEIVGARLTSFDGKEVAVPFVINFAGQSLIDLIDIAPGNYQIRIELANSQFLTRRIVRR